ncbi:MAG: ABC transporter ATP-binding protein [Tissierellia bacterium]|nr:ABC transporter ATP-binding protein [Tissierellia bacterium]
MKKAVELIDITKKFNDNIILDNFNLYINEGEFLTLLGPSGCGKTTTLRIIGGFETQDSGKVLFDGEDISNLPPFKRNVNTVFQKYSLFPNMNVYDNVAFSMKLKKKDKKEIDKRVKEMLELVNLKGFEKRKPDALSGGQQQRVAIARALCNDPEILLLDEPLSALDLKLRKQMQVELKNLQQEVGVTFVYVTHDQEEALTMSDTVVVMNEGKIQQIGAPIDIYNEPKNKFVANFIGESNIVDGVFIKDRLVEFSGYKFDCVDVGFKNNEEVDVVIRPEDIELIEYDENRLSGVVESVVFKGIHYEMLVHTGDFTYKVQSTLPKEESSVVSLKIIDDNIHIMEKRND